MELEGLLIRHLVACLVIVAGCSSALPDAAHDAAQDASIDVGNDDAFVAQQDAAVRDAQDVQVDAAVLPKTPGEHEVEFVFGSTKRRFLLAIPQSYDGTKQVPLVFAFHGNNQSALKAAATYGLREEAAKRGWIVIYGDGVVAQGETGGSWNAYSCCSFARVSQSDDVGYVREVLALALGSLQLDKRRVYATGFSNGAMFTHRLGVELGDRFAAIAPVAGCLSGIPAGGTTRSLVGAPVRQVPFLALHGRKDGTVPFDGGKVDVATFDAEAVSVGFWATQNGCNTTPTTSYPQSGIARIVYGGCTSEVQLVATDEGTHTYLQLEKYGASTASYVLDFFQRFELPVP